jgi:hypothetical protein
MRSVTIFATRVSLTALLLGIVVIGSLTIGETSAWGQSGSNPTIAAALQEIRTALENLTSTEQANVRTTPPMSTGSGAQSLLTCSVVNAASVNRRVRIRSVGNPNPLDTTQALAPNQSLSIVVLTVAGSNVHCTFTVLNGTRADIRGSMALSGGVTGVLAAE